VSRTVRSPGADSRLREYRAVPLCAGCSASQLRDVGRAASRLHLAAGAVLVREGQRSGQFVIVLDGTVEVRRDGCPVDEIGAGGFFGEIALVRRLAEPADVVARTPLTVDVVAPREFASLYAQIDPVRRRIDDALDERIARWIRPSVSPEVATPIESTARPARGRRAGWAGTVHHRVCRCRRRHEPVLP
jgi:CRP-like cAMP-binding protein